MNLSDIHANEPLALGSSGASLNYFQRYALAILSIGVALGTGLLLQYFHFHVPAALLLFAVAISSWYGGGGPAALAAVLAIISYYYCFIEPVYTIYINRSEIPFFIIFVLFAALLAWFGVIRRRIEAGLRAQANLLNLTHDTIFVMNMQGVIQYWNRGAEERYGWPAEEVMGKVVHDLLKTVFPKPLEEIKAELLRTGHWEAELVHTRKDGTQVVVASRWSLQRARNGAPFAILETNNDITERKRAEDELRDTETRFRTFVDHAGDAFFVHDGEQQGRVLDVNRQACESLGYSREELIGMLPQDFDPDVDGGVLQGISERIDTGETYTFETRHWRKDGTAFPVEVRVRSLWHSGRRLHLALARDITERKRAEEALRRLNRELRALSNCNQALLRATDEQSLLEEICRIVCEEAGYRMAFVGYAEHDEAKSVRPVAWTGVEEGYLATVGITWADTERGRGPTGTAIRSGKACCVQDFATDPRLAPWREGLLQRGFCSGIALPLKDENDNAFGSLTIHCDRPDAFTPEEIRLLEELAGDMAFGIVTLRSRAARKQAEEEVALLTFAVNNVQESALLLDETGRFQYVNAEACRVLGYTRAELLRMGVPDIDPVFPAERWSNHWREIKAQGSLNFESIHRTRDGRVFPVEVSANYFEYGGRSYNLALVRDITERKQAEERLRQSEAYLAESERLSHTGSWALDSAGEKYLYLSKEDYRIWGFDPQEGLPSREQVFGRIHPEDRDRWKEKIEDSLRHKTDSSDEYRIVLPDGTVKHIHTIRHAVRNSAGDFVRWVGTTADITERKRAEEALRQSEAYLAEAQRLSHTGSWALDASTREYSYWSDEMFRIFGVDPNGGIPIRETMGRRIHPEDAGRATAGFEKSLREKVDTSDEYRFVLPDGTIKHVQSIRHPVLNDAGDVVQLVGTFIDITERKAAEDALRRSGTYLAETQRLTHTGTFVTDSTTKPLYWSEELFRIFGFDPQHGLPTRDQALQRIHTEDRDPFKQAFDRAIHQKVDAEVEYRIVLPDGRVRHVHGIGHPVWNANGEVVEVVGTTVDVTERKRTEQALRESETRFRTLVDHASDAFFVYDLEQKTVVDVNREACESLGYTRQELVGNAPLAYHLDSYQGEMESVAERAAAEETVLDTHWHLRKDGSRFPVEVHTSLVSYGGRRFLLTVARDITDRFRAEEQREKLRQVEADLAHMSRVSTIGELTASIAHEVNQPLSGIVSSGSACLRWLAANPPNLEEVREAVRRIIGAGKHAGEVIARIRALTKRTSSQQEKLDLNETIREVLVLVGDEAKRNSVILRTVFADGLSPVLGDRVQLQQVVLNLLINAIEAMSGVTERTRDLVITTRNIDPEQVQVTVEDSGMGIEPSSILKIFEPFYTTKSTGMGMGLSISRSILQHHGGRLWATANDGPGTTFHFALPKYHEEEEHAAAASAVQGSYRDRG